MKKFYFFLFLISLDTLFVNAENDSIRSSSDWLGTISQAHKAPEIVRLAWGSVPSQYLSHERYCELKESGITHSVNWFISDPEEIKKELNLAQQSGIQLIIHPSDSNLELVATRFKDHSALAGYFIGDEPKSDLFSAYAESVKRIKSIDQKNYCYINLPRITHYDPQFGRGTENYKKYLDDFLTKINTEFLSYDNYTIYYPKGSNQLIVAPQMFENLEVIRDAAKKSNKDFWAFCLTSKHSVGKGKNFRLYPEPTIGHLRLYVYSNLAYGAQGIEYFTYWQALPSDSANQYGDHFISAPITIDGKRTPVFEKLKIINTEIKNLSFVFAGAKVIWVRHTGDTIPAGTVPLNKELNKTPIKIVQSSSGLIISYIENAGNKYLVLVNRDCTKPMELSIHTSKKTRRVLKSGAIIQPEDKIKITEGDAVIYSWK